MTEGNEAYLSYAKRQVAPLLEILRAFEPGTELVHQAVGVLLLADVLQEVTHDFLEAVLWQIWFRAEIGKDLGKQVVDRRRPLHCTTAIKESYAVCGDF